MAYQKPTPENPREMKFKVVATAERLAVGQPEDAQSWYRWHWDEELTIAIPYGYLWGHEC